MEKIQSVTAQGIQDVTASKAGLDKRERAKIKESAREFEAIFLETMLKSMRQSIEKSGLIDGGNAERMYESMLDSEYAKQMASQNMTGIAADIEKQLLQAAGYKPEGAALREVRQANLQKIQGLAGYGAVSAGKLP